MDDSATTRPSEPSGGDASSAPPRSLWQVMSGSTSTVRDTPVAPPVADSQDQAARPKGLWSVMKPAEIEPVEEPRSLPTEPAPQSRISPIPSLVPVVEPGTCVWSRSAIAAGVCGIATLCLSLLSLWPGWWFRIPVLIAGLVAAGLGLISADDVARSRGRRRGRAVAWLGIVCGAAGILLAPTLLARWGEAWREAVRQDEIAAKLKMIGAALDRHHDQLGHYPAATLLSREANGLPLHGWMTPLLSFVGHEALFQRIDLNQPFDSPANREAMSSVIDEFTASRTLPSRGASGLALTHFAGVGGTEAHGESGFVHLGVFDERGAVKREAVSDGLSQTIIVGEIASELPPWGQPGNIRSIGKGLNRQAHGFGNSAGTGAMFLHADGSARFYSNSTDRRVLQQLESRDGGESP